MSSQTSANKSKRGNSAIDSTVNMIYEEIVEEDIINRPSSLKDTKGIETVKKTAHFNGLDSSEKANSCPNHPNNSIQFYCLNNKALLCNECLARGRFNGLEVINLKKAAEKLKGKLSDIAKETVGKVETCQNLEREMNEQRSQVEKAFSGFKEDVIKKMNTLREAINQKEEDLIKKISTVKEEKLSIIKNTVDSLKTYIEGIKSFRSMIEEKIIDMDDLNVCQYYSLKGDTFKDSLDNEICIRIQRVQKIIDQRQLQDKMSFIDLQDQWKRIQNQINSMGVEINSNKTESTYFTTEKTQTKSKESLNTDSDRHKDVIDSPVFKKIQTSLYQMPSYLQTMTDGNLKSSVVPPRVVGRKPNFTLDLKFNDSGKKNLSLKFGGQMASPCNDNLSKKLDSRENMNAPMSARDANSSTLLSSRQSPRSMLLDSFLVNSKSPTGLKKSPIKRPQKYSIGTIESYLPSGESLNNRERPLSSKRIENLKTERVSSLDIDSVFGSKKVYTQKESGAISDENRLKNKLKQLNSQVFK